MLRSLAPWTPKSTLHRPDRLSYTPCSGMWWGSDGVFEGGSIAPFYPVRRFFETISSTKASNFRLSDGGKLSMMCCLARSPSAIWSDASAVSRSSFNRSASLVCKMKPVSPTISGKAATELAMGTHSQSMASQGALGKPSQMESWR